MPELNLLEKEVILTILAEKDSSEERQRRRDSFNAYQVFQGNIEPYVKRYLAEKRPKSYKSYTISDISLSGMIIGKRSTAYDEGVIRTVDESDEKTEVLNDIYDEADADSQLEFFDCIYNLNRHALMWVNYLTEKEKYQFMTLQPFEAVIVRDKDTGELLIVGLNYPSTDITQDADSGDGIPNLIAESQADSGGNTETWVFWSAKNHVKISYKKNKIVNEKGETILKRDIDYIPMDRNPNFINPLGRLPFVYKSMDQSPDNPVKNPITDQTIKFNAQQSETLTSKNVHGTGIQVFKYPEKMQGKFDKMTFGQLSAIELPQSSDPDDSETDFEYKTSGAQLTPMKEIDFAYAEQVAKQHGLENFEIDKSSVSVMNGISRAIAGASVQKVITRNQKAYSKLEKDIFEIVKAWDRYNKGKNFSEDDAIQVVFPKPKVLVSDKETLDNIEKMLDLGLIEQWEKLVKIDPNLSEQEAKEKLQRINQEKEDRAKKFLTGSINNGNNQERVNQESELEPQGPEQRGEEQG